MAFSASLPCIKKQCDKAPDGCKPWPKPKSDQCDSRLSASKLQYLHTSTCHDMLSHYPAVIPTYRNHTNHLNDIE